jgi:hypothetical protein
MSFFFYENKSVLKRFIKSPPLRIFKTLLPKKETNQVLVIYKVIKILSELMEPTGKILR